MSSYMVFTRYDLASRQDVEYVSVELVPFREPKLLHTSYPPAKHLPKEVNKPSQEPVPKSNPLPPIQHMAPCKISDKVGPTKTESSIQKTELIGTGMPIAENTSTKMNAFVLQQNDPRAQHGFIPNPDNYNFDQYQGYHRPMYPTAGHWVPSHYQIEHQYDLRRPENFIAERIIPADVKMPIHDKIEGHQIHCLGENFRQQVPNSQKPQQQPVAPRQTQVQLADVSKAQETRHHPDHLNQSLKQQPVHHPKAIQGQPPLKEDGKAENLTVSEQAKHKSMTGRLQKVIKNQTDEEKLRTFKALKLDLEELIYDQYGKYVIILLLKTSKMKSI